MRLVCRLRAARESSGESLRSVADRSGVFRGHLSEIERGIRLPTDAEAETLARVYGLAIEEFYAAPPHALQVGLVPDKEQGAASVTDFPQHVAGEPGAEESLSP